jgi:hypothetical protein
MASRHRRRLQSGSVIARKEASAVSAPVNASRYPFRSKTLWIIVWA